ncbi:DUF2141 domain-containing protein [Galbibacter sp. BG1]|uniref:DUF2141 domain-containing protein n=1 Tax=Galbibacter sp. BG1 TaxID=1170699 RepID=UPI0015B9A0B8|nr:DUF2141 domain-containing protein [Galbibacter sp. BG1]QLE01585.1 DUF2141 domain-containing protein [Galbibacter sp. BG1]
MKNFLIITITFICTAFSYGQEKNKEGQGVSIEVQINNVTNSKGMVLLSLHNEETFMKGPGIKNLHSEIKDGKVSMTFNNVAPGTYAILALHDENNNERMDFNSQGMPLEDYGMSNNDMTYGPPQFSSAKFEVTDKNQELEIRF